jgi:protein-glucosylgalactosylhydroxylysine glucosidase
MIRLPDLSEIPTLSNGHIAFVINGNAILMNGLYNGERGESHRARIPNYSNLEVDVECGATNCAFSLNMRKGIFEATISSNTNHRFLQQIYAHRFYNRAIINKFTLARTSPGAITREIFINPGALPSVDLNQKDSTVDDFGGVIVTTTCFETKVREDPFYQPTPSRVCICYTKPPTQMILPADQESVEYLHITTVGRSQSEVKKEMQDILNNRNTLLEKHTTAWENDWNKFEISVGGNSNLNKIVHASIFYLVSNLPSENTNQPQAPFYGLAPGGLGKGGVLYESYQGHSFWDTEMWMHPPMLLLNPQWSKDILSYRYNVRKAAEDNARNTGYKGYRYPWESAFTGREVTPDCCPEVVEYQHHIISDIAFAFRSHLAATHDVDWFKTVGCDIAWNTAKFWESRVKYNESTRFYDIRSEYLDHSQPE